MMNGSRYARLLLLDLNAKTRFVASTALLASTLFATSSALAISEAPPMRWAKGAFGFSSSNEYFMTHANYDSARGSYQRLTGDNSFSSFNSTLRGRYAFNPTFSVFGGFGSAYVRAVDPTTDKTNSGLTDVFAGVNVVAWKRWIRLVPELMASFPITKTKALQTTPLMSDGVAYADASIYAFKPFRYLTLLGHFGIHLPSEGMSKLWKYSAGAEIPFGRQFAVGGGVRGYETAVNDDLTAAERAKTTTSANAGSLHYYSSDPALLEAQGWVAFRPDSAFELKVGYAKTLDGKRSAEGQSVLFSLAFLSDSGRSSERESARRVQERKKSNEQQEFSSGDLELSGDTDAFEADDKASSNSEALDATEKMLEKR